MSYREVSLLRDISLRRLWGLLSLLRVKVEMSRLVRDWRFWCEAIAEAAGRVLGSCRVLTQGCPLKSEFFDYFEL